MSEFSMNEPFEPIERHHPRMPPTTAFGLKPLIDRGFRISVGAYSYGTPALKWNEAEKTAHSVEIGAFCSIAAEVSIYVGTQGIHPLDFVSTYPMRMVFGPVAGAERPAGYERDLSVVIGSDVWIGRDTIIQAGVRIGHGAVIGTRALVTSDIEPYTIAAGIPAKPLRKRFTDEQIARFLALKWWTWEEERIRKVLRQFATRDIDWALDALEAVAP
ncbi:CatB-related O-acetyltransferase [Rhodobacter capsulatus]|jgi:chloramphenicol O-acetyltransferase type B|uniref:Chloramphenicol acetyltransferase n=2 Tax=Rhodobacter capsulatus TaxID=1061 RepID=D5AV66_RHOCB|nr:CatB-related O-acetyltransferase [Rhodobacter capsulatus]ADE85848.1 chloramphenicol acetyltransferase [Rhodobacter capsulatus SB 1003]MDS0927684.1 CatB-related O-acetyltransferase [Rhodobacter capsulatus]TQD32191.1 CatB-related O-acetyltransferase [Rhodobacter capsulatus]